MDWTKVVFKFSLMLLLSVCMQWQKATASHITSGDLYWVCVQSGPDAGKFIFYMTAYRDCSIPNQTITAPQLAVSNCPTMTSLALTLVSQTDVTSAACGYSCADGIADISVEQYIFASAPVSIPGPPPPQGYVFTYQACCRNDVQNLVNSTAQNFYFSVTMYPYNNQNTDPCFDSSPQFAENPSSLRCSGYELRYNNNALDPDLDSLSYSFSPALGTAGSPIQYAPGFSANSPLPGPNTITLDPVTGQFQYQSNASDQGSYSMIVAVDAWRCGQRKSRTIREMTVSFVACATPNNIPNINPPIWASPGAANGYEVTVQAGDLVNFTLSATDNDMNGATPQVMTFTAEGSQLGTGCIAPCATLSNVTPPATGSGTITTTFNWQTTCDHVATYNACANTSNTYNFLFKVEDDFCPASGSTIVNVSVTVLGEPVVPSPDPHCVSTAANGDITLSWQPVTDNAIPPSFVEYVIYHSLSSSGPFQQIATVPTIGTGTYTHTSANPIAAPTTSGPNFYYIRTKSGCNNAQLEAAVDTVSSIYLTLNNTGTTANLNWTPVATPPLASSNGNGQGLYQVFREYPVGTWTQIGTTFGLNYVDPVIWCNEQVNYRIDLTDNLPCTSMSNVVGDILNNPAEPDPQPLDSVIVDPITGLVTICWPPSTSLNVVQYNIFVNPNQFAWVPVDTVYGYNNTCWTDPNSDPSSGSIWYQVTATNNCDVTGLPAGSLIDNTDHHETMLLLADYDSCIHIVTLNWEKYWYWPEGIKEYDVYASLNGAPFVKIGTTPDTTFIHDQLQLSAQYCYFVRAVKNVSNRVTASSNARCIVAKVPKRPEYSYNYKTTVQPTNAGVEEYFFVDSTAGYLGFKIERGKDPSSMTNLWFIPFDPTTRYYAYTDASARPSLYSYYYSIIGVDSCDLNADTLNMSRTILLEATANTDRTNSLEWNEYEGWRGPITAYNIYRSVDGPYEYLRTVPPGQLTLTDSIQDIIVGEGNFCYYVEAVEGPSPPVGTVNPVLFQELSESNRACAKQHPNVFTPNAFMPEGVNNVFKPVTVYVEAASYLFQIYNKWGQRIFETHDPNEGWNGSWNGKPLQQGAYVFHVSFVSSSGQSYVKNGSITLIR